MKSTFTLSFIIILVLSTQCFGRTTNINPLLNKNNNTKGGTPSNLSVGLLRYIDPSLGYLPVDNAILAFNDNYSNGLGQEDGAKIAGASDNISFVENGVSLGVDGRKLPVLKDTIHILVDQLSTADYQLGMDATSYVSNGLNPYLYDDYKKTNTFLSTDSITYVNFSVDLTKKATYTNRFYIIFKSATLPIINLFANITEDKGANKISWLALNTKERLTYSIEKSSNGIQFNTIGKTTSNYYVDNTINLLKVYYRVKTISNEGNISYSNVLIANEKTQALSLSVYPNPVLNNAFTINFSTIAEGTYEVYLIDELGKQVYNETINHKYGTEKVSLKNKLSAGTYHLLVNGKDANYKTQLLIK